MNGRDKERKRKGNIEKEQEERERMKKREEYWERKNMQVKDDFWDTNAFLHMCMYLILWMCECVNV